MTNQIFGFIYARSDSERLPGKPFIDFGGVRLIDIVFARAHNINVREVVLLTTDRLVDDSLADYCKSQGYEVFRGDASNLIERTLRAIRAYGADGFVRLNGDCPFLEPTLVNEGLVHLNTDFGFVSNLIHRTYPYGVAVECVSSALFSDFADFARDEELEHVTSHLYRLQHHFKRVSMKDSIADHSALRLTVDTPDDCNRFRIISAEVSMISDPYWQIFDFEPPLNTYTREHSKG